MVVRIFQLPAATSSGEVVSLDLDGIDDPDDLLLKCLAWAYIRLHRSSSDLAYLRAFLTPLSGLVGEEKDAGEKSQYSISLYLTSKDDRANIERQEMFSFRCVC